MKRTALLLGAVMLSGLLATPASATATAAPRTVTAARASQAGGASAAAPRVATAVAKVKAAPARQSAACPTTVAFSAVVAAKGRGTVRYRWVRGDGSKGAVRSFRVNGRRSVVVKDRQTYDRTTSGWQAVEVLGRRGLSGKARFSVTCAGPVKVYDVATPLPADPDAPLVAAADVDVRPASYTGACPTNVVFTATVQVSRTPATVAYQWIDSAGGEGRPETLTFAAGGPRVRQVVLPLSVGSSTGGWKAVHLLGPNGHDSARAAYQVTCRRTPPTDPSPGPTSTPSTTSTPTPTTTTTPPPPVRPATEITAVTPGDYEGSCVEPVAYQAAGRVTLPAGAAQKITYWWTLDGTAWQRQSVDFPASGQARSQDVSAGWNLGATDTGAHTLALLAEGATATGERKFTFTCGADPGAADLKLKYMLTSQYKGVCDGSFPLHARALLSTDREAEVRYRFVVDGKPGVTRTEVLKPGIQQAIDDVWYSRATAGGSGTVRLEVLNHNRIVKENPYTWTCVAKNPSPGTVDVVSITTTPYFGDCVEAPYVTAHGALRAAAGTQITWRWVVDGRPDSEYTATVEASGLLQVQSAYWHRTTKTSGTVRLEVLNHNKPSAEETYPVTCKN
ncbi:hypothetical protein HTZ77_33980 [Nonomuraea sp. SMC257]|uniref:Ig-like domain-containing protein n=1 Tax=Nonomuraea montanisoli TaxID=2741721 RepID=A0A7Y6IEX3_9ACTN|nr:hypothetical protein [Nonomuraea montanisoli]NUW36383.1 hypothetical protein [Nonomuraea montanisoli]